MSEYHLHCWSVGSTEPFRAPELDCKNLAGRRSEDNLEVVTSSIVSVDGRRVTTHSGSVYILEDIDPDYLYFMQENGYEYDPENPIKIRNL